MSALDPLRDVWRRLGCTPAESFALGLLALGAVAVLALVWWQGRPADGVTGALIPAELAGTASEGATETAAPPASVSEPNIQVHVTGQVARPGVYELAAEARVIDAVTAAGGPSSSADIDAVNLAQPLGDGMQIRVPTPGETPAAGLTTGGTLSTDPVAGVGAAGVGAAGGKVDLNTADLTVLQTLPGIGPVTAQKILDHRTDIGRFTTVDELLDVRGIGEATMAELADKVTVG